MLEAIVRWLRDTTWYCDMKYERFQYKGEHDDKFQEILEKQKPNTFFRIGWYILFTNESRKCAWIYHDQKTEANHG